MRAGVLSFAFVAACGFQPGQLATDDGGGGIADSTDGPGSDGDVGAPEVAHVAVADEAALTSTAQWTISSDVTLDTSMMTAVPAIPADVHVAVVAQEGGGPELLVVQVARLDVTARLRAIGSRPLVIVATDEIHVSSGGMIDVSALNQRPGAGGGAPSTGTGAGGDGTDNTTAQDSGGTGASFGTLGGKGGNGNTSTSGVAVSPDPLPAYGSATLATLEGGSGGGDPSPMCATDRRLGGGGGGAVQLTTPSLVLDGTVSAGGGGGMATNACNGNGLSGGGGGSGGAIYIEAASVTGTGVLAANGGGGSGSATGGGSPGAVGANGMLDGTPALGGVGQFGDGGNGATSGNAMPGEQGDNGGGGGGGSGRIYLSIPAAIVLSLGVSPPAVRAP